MTERSIVGVWRLASTRATDPDGRQVGRPFGPRGMGLVTFTADGRMMSVLVDGRASLPEGTPRQYSSYCGNYTFDGATLTTVVDANCDPVRFPAPQIRKVRFEGERMVLTPPPSEVGSVDGNLYWSPAAADSAAKFFDRYRNSDSFKNSKSVYAAGFTT